MNDKELAELPVEDFWRLFPDTYGVNITNNQWIAYRHLKFALRRIAYGLMRPGGGYNAILNMPASYGKSLSCSVILPTWYLDTFPGKQVILTGYSGDHVKVFARQTRDMIKDNPKVNVKLKHTTAKAIDFETSTGGSYWAQGMLDGQLTGHHFDLGIVDDPIKTWDEAINENFRERIKKWYHSVFYNRRKPGASMLLVQTRWHEDDLTGFLMDKEPKDWDLISLPAIAEAGDMMGRAKGDVLCPELYPKEHVYQVKAKTPPIIWDAMDQQRPSALAGNVIKREWWQYWKEKDLPLHWDEIISCADLNFFKDKKLKNDRTAYLVLGRRGSKIFVLHAYREILDFDVQVTEFHNLVKRYPQIGAKLVEDKANGHALETTLKNTIPGILLVPPNGGKLARVLGVLSFWKAKNIYVPDDDVKYPWVKDFINEHANFPSGRYDDQVDAMSLGLVYFQEQIQGGLEFYTNKNVNKNLKRLVEG